LIAVDAKDRHVIGASRFHGYDEEKSEIEIGWTFLARSHWGGIYNKEMKHLMLRHAFRFVDRVVFLVGPQNVRSQRAMERLGGVRTRKECATAISAFERAWDEHGFGLFALELPASGRLIGFVGLSVPHFLPELLPAVEIGWRLAADQWGKGLATDGARATLAFGFGQAGLNRIVSIHQVVYDAYG